MTIAVFIAVPAAVVGSAQIKPDEEHTYRHAMGVLILLNLVIFVNENTKIFTTKVCCRIVGCNRLITVAVTLALWIIVICVTTQFGGRELVWLAWIITSLCISGYQMLYIVITVAVDFNYKKKFLLK